MKVTIWGTRGSLPTPGPETAHYGGNTSCVEVESDDGTVLVLDAGTGVRRLGLRGATLPLQLRRILTVPFSKLSVRMDHVAEVARLVVDANMPRSAATLMQWLRSQRAARGRNGRA